MRVIYVTWEISISAPHRTYLWSSIGWRERERERVVDIGSPCFVVLNFPQCSIAQEARNSSVVIIGLLGHHSAQEIVEPASNILVFGFFNLKITCWPEPWWVSELPTWEEESIYIWTPGCQVIGYFLCCSWQLLHGHSANVSLNIGSRF